MTSREAHEARVQSRRLELAHTCKTLFSSGNIITLEIGCGHGHFLAAYAKEFPDEFCVGIDIVSKRVRKGQSKQSRGELENLVYLKAEARDFLHVLAHDVVIQRCFILFPDPWPKKRHAKKRLIQPDFLSQLASRMCPEGWLYFRTDDDPYFEWTLERLAAHPDWELDEEEPWRFEQESFFQSLMSGWKSLIARCLKEAVSQ